MKDRKRKNLLYLLTFCIPFITALIGLIRGGFAPFGTKNVLSASDFSNYLPYFYELYDRVHEGQSLGYSNLHGLGYDFSSLLTYHLSDPSNYLILLFPRTAIPAVLNLLYAIKIGLSGLSASLYFSYHLSQIKTDDNYTEEADNNPNENKKAKIDIIIGSKIENTKFGNILANFDWITLSLSIVFALSTTIISIGMNITYLSAIAIFPILILGVEKIINEQNIKVFTIALFFSVLFNIHISIISFIFVLIYFLTRNFKDTKHIFISIKLFTISSILGILSNSFIIINSLQGSFFKEDISIIFPTFILSNPFDSLKQLMSFSPISYLSIYGNNTDIAFGIGIIFLTILSFFNNKNSLKQRIKNLIIYLFLLAGIFTTTFHFMVNGMSINAAFRIHFSYIIVFYSLILTCSTLTNIRSFKSYSTIISASIMALFIIGSMLLSANYDASSPFIYSLEFLFVIFILTLIFNNRSIVISLYKLIAALIIICEVIIPYSINISSTGNSIVSYSISNTNSMIYYEASRYIHSFDQDALVIYYNSDEFIPLKSDLLGYDYVIVNTTYKNNMDFYLEYLEDFS
nr:YfhO family protein [Eubacterium sp.]